jgi:biopolymer transport protein ExbD
MSSACLKKMVLSWIVTMAALFLAPHLSSQETSSKPTIVQIDMLPRGLVYKVDSKTTGSDPTDDLLHALNQVADQHGANQPVFVFVDPRLPINEIWNVNGVAAKAQLTNVRFFVFFRENQKMTEIKWTPFVPSPYRLG